MVEIKTQSAADIKPRFTAILWGPSKVGKTTFAATAPGKKLHICVDPEGFIPISYRNDIQILRLDDLEIGEIVRFGTKQLATQIENLADEIDTVIFDSLSSFAHAALLYAIEKNIGKSAKFTPTIEAPGLAAYGARKEYILVLVRNLLRVTARKNLNCIFIGHEDDPQLDSDGKFLYQSIMLSTKTINSVGLAVSEIWFMSENNNKRKIAIRPCRGHKPMGSRMFVTNKEPEFILNYDPAIPDTEQDHIIANWWQQWEANDRNKIPLPK